MKIAYFDCFSGVSGDMILGALIDAGLALEDLKKALSPLAIKGFTLKASAVRKGDLRATKIDVVADSPPSSAAGGLKMLTDLEKVIRRSRMDEPVRQMGLRVLNRLIQAEARAHGISAGRLRLHGMDPVDTLVDIMGAVIGLSLLGIQQVVSSSIPVGSGLRGMAPATAELLKGAPIYSLQIAQELTTPTGAALLTTLATDFSPTPPITLRSVGYGAGTSDLALGPNLLRVLIGETLALAHAPLPYETDRVIEFESNIDDLSPQIYEHLMERLLLAGALDVSFAPIIMKKGRPATRVTVLTLHPRAEEILKLLFQETTTLGVRMSEITRAKLSRTEREVSTRFGKVRVKITEREPGRMDAVPEYQECKEIAQRTGLSLRTILDEVKSAVRKLDRTV